MSSDSTTNSSSSSSSLLDQQQQQQQQQNSKFHDMESIKSYSNTDEYLYAMREDLAEWFNSMYSTSLNAETFIESMENGVLICQHAKQIMKAADDQQSVIYYKNEAKPQSFHARDNISNFIKWCRNYVKVRECLMFETDDLILRKNEKNFILCLLEIARYGSKYGIQVPTIIKLEQEIDNEMKKASLPVDLLSLNSSINDDDLDDSLEKSSSMSPVSYDDSSSLASSTSSLSNNKTKEQSLDQQQQEQQQQIIIQPEEVKIKLIKKNLNNEFFKNMPSPASASSKQTNLKIKQKTESELENHVNKLVNRCTCEKKFPVVQIGEGKYRIGSTNTIVFIRVGIDF